MSEDNLFSGEPEITINGVPLSTAGAMTLRVAIGSFAMSLRETGLGDDDVGQKICEGYLMSCAMIEALMKAKPPHD